MAKRIVKSFRLNNETINRLNELKKVYEIESDGLLLERILKDIYELKKSKALVPFEELDKRDKELKQAFFELGKLKNTVDEREKTITELKAKKGLLKKLFGF